MSVYYVLDAHYDKRADKIDDLWDFVLEGYADTAIKYLDLKPTSKLADIGGGTGAVAEIISRKAG